jgi:excinuclease UvrABC nuclease subunit
LLRVFGSAKRVREAPVEQVAAVPGIGPALAARIKAGMEG